MSKHDKAKEYASKLRDKRLIPEIHSAYLAGYDAALKSVELFIEKQHQICLPARDVRSSIVNEIDRELHD